MKLKTLWYIWLILFVIIFIPINFSFCFENLADDEIIINFQSCGCPCPNAEVEKGTLRIPDSLKTKIKPNFIESNIIGKDPYVDIELWTYSFKIKGEIIGAQPEECDENGCYYSPIINVKSFEASEYISWFLYWNPKLRISYLIFLLFLLLTNIVIGLFDVNKKRNKEI